MEQEQIIKRLEWLDDERRKDKMTIAAMEERLLAAEGGLPNLQQQIRELSADLARVTSTLGRLDQVDAAIAQIRVDYTRSMEAIEKQRADKERETEKIRRVELEGVNKSLTELRRGLEPIPDLKKGIQTRMEEEFRLGRLIEEVEQKLVEYHHSDEEYRRALRLLEEGRRQDVKRITDLTGELAALRKRLEEQRGKVDVTADGLRKFEMRLSELMVAENERRQAQAAFMEKQALVQVERERTWRDWHARFEQVEKQALGLDSQVQTLDVTNRSVKRSQDALDEVTQRIERRINEITEIQRLSEDRFRQDWTGFKADDQKRWTNYTLSQEEQQREITRHFDKVGERIIYFDDMLQDIQDQLQQVNEEAEKRLQGLLALAHEWMSAYERAFGRTK